jgi:hypothetical protein
MRRLLLAIFVVVGCSKDEPAPAASSAGPASSAPVFDIDGFCDKTLGVGRPCDGDDELLEGNKIGLCTTTLREAGVTLDPALAPACIAAVEAGKPLPDVRTLEMLVARFEPCRKLLSPIAALAKVEPRAAGTAAAGAACTTSADCGHGHFCPKDADPKKRVCTAQKKAGTSCVTSDECLGRCSGQAVRQCVAFCGEAPR